jgi:hypothetical protein
MSLKMSLKNVGKKDGINVGKKLEEKEKLRRYT